MARAAAEDGKWSGPGMASGGHVAVNMDKSIIVSVVTQSIEDIAGSMKSSSPKRASGELDVLKGWLMQVAMCVVASDGALMRSRGRCTWRNEAAATMNSGPEWPPQWSLKDDQELMQTHQACL